MIKLNKKAQAPKKAQAQIIVTVLIILIVIGIIAFVGTFITRTVRQGTEDATAQADCLKVGISINEAANGNPISVKRSVGGSTSVDVKIYIDGTLNETIPGIGELETKTGNTALVTGQQVEIAADINGTSCDFADTQTVA